MGENPSLISASFPHLPLNRVLHIFDIHNLHRPKRFQFFETRKSHATSVHNKAKPTPDRPVVESKTPAPAKDNGVSSETGVVSPEAASQTRLEAGTNPKSEAPHFWITKRVDLGNLEDLRNKLLKGVDLGRDLLIARLRPGNFPRISADAVRFQDVSGLPGIFALLPAQRLSHPRASAQFIDIFLRDRYFANRAGCLEP